MLYNKNKYRVNNDKKVLRKIGKHWVSVSLITLALLGGSTLATHIGAHANADSINGGQGNDGTNVATQAQVQPAASSGVQNNYETKGAQSAQPSQASQSTQTNQSASAQSSSVAPFSAGTSSAASAITSAASGLHNQLMNSGLGSTLQNPMSTGSIASKSIGSSSVNSGAGIQSSSATQSAGSASDSNASTPDYIEKNAKYNLGSYNSRTVKTTAQQKTAYAKYLASMGGQSTYDQLINAEANSQKQSNKVVLNKSVRQLLGANDQKSDAQVYQFGDNGKDLEPWNEHTTTFTNLNYQTSHQIADTNTQHASDKVKYDIDVLIPNSDNATSGTVIDYGVPYWSTLSDAYGQFANKVDKNTVFYYRIPNSSMTAFLPIYNHGTNGHNVLANYQYKDSIFYKVTQDDFDRLNSTSPSDANNIGRWQGSDVGRVLVKAEMYQSQSDENGMPLSTTYYLRLQPNGSQNRVSDINATDVPSDVTNAYTPDANNKTYPLTYEPFHGIQIAPHQYSDVHYSDAVGDKLTRTNDTVGLPTVTIGNNGVQALYGGKPVTISNTTIPMVTYKYYKNVGVLHVHYTGKVRGQSDTDLITPVKKEAEPGNNINIISDMPTIPGYHFSDKPGRVSGTANEPNIISDVKSDKFLYPVPNTSKPAPGTATVHMTGNQLNNVNYLAKANFKKNGVIVKALNNVSIPVTGRIGSDVTITTSDVKNAAIKQLGDNSFNRFVATPSDTNATGWAVASNNIQVNPSDGTWNFNLNETPVNSTVPHGQANNPSDNPGLTPQPANTEDSGWLYVHVRDYKYNPTTKKYDSLTNQYMKRMADFNKVGNQTVDENDPSGFTIQPSDFATSGYETRPSDSTLGTHADKAYQGQMQNGNLVSTNGSSNPVVWNYYAVPSDSAINSVVPHDQANNSSDNPGLNPQPLNSDNDWFYVHVKDFDYNSQDGKYDKPGKEYMKRMANFTKIGNKSVNELDPNGFTVQPSDFATNGYETKPTNSQLGTQSDNAYKGKVVDGVLENASGSNNPVVWYYYAKPGDAPLNYNPDAGTAAIPQSDDNGGHGDIHGHVDSDVNPESQDNGQPSDDHGMQVPAGYTPDTTPSDYNFKPSDAPTGPSDNVPVHANAIDGNVTVHNVYKQSDGTVDGQDDENVPVKGHVGDNPIQINSNDYTQYKGNQYSNPNNPVVQTEPMDWRQAPNGDNNNYHKDVTFTFVRKRAAQYSTITVNYADVNGNGGYIDSMSPMGKVGNPFDLHTYEENPPYGYHFVSILSETGPMQQFTAGNQEVTLGVAKDKQPAKKGAINIQYVDNHGNVVSSTTQLGKDGKPFNVDYYEHNTPAGYVFDGIKSGANITEFTKNPQDLVVGVKRQPTYSDSVNVIYEDNHGHVISSTTELGQSDAPFDVDKYEHDTPAGFDFDRIISGANIDKFMSTPQTLILGVHKANDDSDANNSLIDVEYKNPQGDVVSDVPVTGKNGQPFDVAEYEHHVPAGYHLVRIVSGEGIDKFGKHVQKLIVEVAKNKPAKTPKKPITPQVTNRGTGNKGNGPAKSMIARIVPSAKANGQAAKVHKMNTNTAKQAKAKAANVKAHVTNNNHKHAKLPQTGEAGYALISAIVAGLASLALAGVDIDKKRYNA